MAIGVFTALQDAEIEEAADLYLVPFDYLKAYIALESSGNPSEANRVVYPLNGSLERGRLLPYVGLFERTVEEHEIVFDSLLNNRAAQTYALAYIMSHIKDTIDPWLMVDAMLYSGIDPVALSRGQALTRLRTLIREDPK